METADCYKLFIYHNFYQLSYSGIFFLAWCLKSPYVCSIYQYIFYILVAICLLRSHGHSQILALFFEPEKLFLYWAPVFQRAGHASVAHYGGCDGCEAEFSVACYRNVVCSSKAVFQTR